MQAGVADVYRLHRRQSLPGNEGVCLVLEEGMTKAEMDMLEKVFAAEISGSLHQTQSKVAKKLEAEGYIVLGSMEICRDRFGVVKMDGYRTTLKGNAEYCMSERCA